MPFYLSSCVLRGEYPSQFLTTVFVTEYTEYLLLFRTRRPASHAGRPRSRSRSTSAGHFRLPRRAIQSRGLDKVKRGDLWQVDGMRKACESHWLY